MRQTRPGEPSLTIRRIVLFAAAAWPIEKFDDADYLSAPISGNGGGPFTGDGGGAFTGNGGGAFTGNGGGPFTGDGGGPFTEPFTEAITGGAEPPGNGLDAVPV
jgi:hypothetical protein